MTDNITLPGTGTIVAMDEVVDPTLGTVKTEFVKIMSGELDSYEKIGGTAANGLDVDPTRLPAGENHLGEIGGKTKITNITFTLDTSAYADGDVLADTQILSACLRVNDGTGVLVSAQFNDEDDQGQPFDVYVLDANNSLGTENSAPNISDTNARAILGKFQVYASDFYDLGGVRVAFKNNLDIPIVGATGTDDVYLALVSRGTGTYTASGITARFAILCD